jgi:hypothetical protein
MEEARGETPPPGGHACAARRGRRGRSAPVGTAPILTALAYVVIAVVDVVAGSGVNLLSMVALGSAFAVSVGSWRRTPPVSVLAVTMCCDLGLYDGQFEHRRGFAVVVSVSV